MLYICFAILLIIMLSSTAFMFNHIKNTVAKEFEYYIDVIRNSKSSNGTAISFRENYLKNNNELPIITLKCKGKSYNFLMDSGANKNFLSNSVLKSINEKNDLVIKENTDKLIVGGGELKSGQRCIIPLYLNKLKFEEEFDVYDFDETFNSLEKESGIKVDGVLGNLFFKKHRWMLDFEDLVVWIR